MKVKKYIVDSLPKAMAQIKVDLGNDAMILHTKKIKTGGFLGLFRKEKIEVIAAVDNTTNKQIATSQAANHSISKSNTEKAIKSYNNNAYQNTRSSNSTIANDYPKKVETQLNRGKEESTSALSAEVSEIKKMMIKMMINQSDSTNVQNYQKNVKLIYERLIKQGVKEEVVQNIIENVLNRNEERIDSIDMWQVVKEQIIHKFKANGANREIDTDVKVVHFVGPTGVGKTTTIAKLAAEKVLKQKKKIAFITADTYRIGAVDQLRTYAEILHAPIEVVFSPQDTHKAIEKLSSYDLILMDTAGRNYHNDMYISELNNILTKTVKSTTYLVVSLTHKYEDMLSILEQFKKINIDKVLFTKFDETLTYGSMLNIMTMFPYEASYVTHGQNVPDDIEVFNEEKMARAILGV